MPKSTWTWSSRIFFPLEGSASLDWGQELWNWDIAAYDSADAIADALKRVGRTYDDDDILYHATRSQLMDVVDAAGGIERAHARFHQSMTLAQEAYEKWN